MRMPLTKPSFKSIIRSKMTTWKMYLVCMEDQSRKIRRTATAVVAAEIYQQSQPASEWVRGKRFRPFFPILFIDVDGIVLRQRAVTAPIAHFSTRTHIRSSFGCCVPVHRHRFRLHLSYGSCHLTGCLSFFIHLFLSPTHIRWNCIIFKTNNGIYPLLSHCSINSSQRKQIQTIFPIPNSHSFRKDIVFTSLALQTN